MTPTCKVECRAVYETNPFYDGDDNRYVVITLYSITEEGRSLPGLISTTSRYILETASNHNDKRVVKTHRALYMSRSVGVQEFEKLADTCEDNAYILFYKVPGFMKPFLLGENFKEIYIKMGDNYWGSHSEDMVPKETKEKEEPKEHYGRPKLKL